jgi:ketosteroid isomerase-like protein
MHPRFIRYILTGLIVSAMSHWAAATAPQPEVRSVQKDSADELLNAARGALRLAEGGKLGELWDDASHLLKSRVSRHEFVEQTSRTLQSRGPLATRDWSSVAIIHQTQASSAVPVGRYANVDFSARSTSGFAASERVSFVFENGAWRFTGYIQPQTQSARTNASPPPSTARGFAPPAGEPTAATGTADAEAAVRAWAAAWAAKEIDTYLAAYAPNFAPSGGKDRSTWATERRLRISEKSHIRVTLENLAIQVDGQVATARFNQTYVADAVRDRSRKTLEMERVGTRWLIRRESSD